MTAGSSQPEAPAPAAADRRPVIAGAVIGLGTLAAGLFADPTRGLTALLAAGWWAVAASLGGVALLALCQAANAGFHVTMKRVFEALGAALPVGAAALLAVLPGAKHVFRWAASDAGSDPLIAAKRAYLNLPAFTVRAVIFFGLWLAFAFLLRRASRAQDQDGSLGHTRSGVVTSALFLLVGGYSISLASVDWLMSTDPHWASTIYGFYTIGGVLQTGAAVAAIAVIALRRQGRLPEVTEDHLHDLGKLLFAFSTLWAYLWFSQYLLIWYANLPEETAWILSRTSGGWGALFWANVVINWVLPFLLLLPRPAKRNPGHLFRVAALVLFGRFLDVWLQVGPSNLPDAPALPWVELAALIGVGSIFALVFLRMLEGAPLLARNDPYLVEALHHRA